MVEALKKQKEKLKEVLITVQSYKGDVDRCKLVSWVQTVMMKCLSK